MAAHVDPDRGCAPLVYEPSEVDTVRAAHPLASMYPMLRETLLQAADVATHLMIVTDAHGDILWRAGERDVLRGGERVGLVEGTRWSEESVGTNAMGTALAADRPVRIHSAEHFQRSYDAWTCAAAPIHDPDTGRLLGTVDITGPHRGFHPMTFALVVAAARLAENQLAIRAAIEDERVRDRNLPHLLGLGDEAGALLSAGGRVLATRPAGWLASRVAVDGGPGPVRLGELGDAVLEPLAGGWLLRLPRPGANPLPALALSMLGARQPVIRLDGERVALSLRHAELLTVLALHPDGMTADQLATAVYPDGGSLVTVRSEIHRLRGRLGADVIQTLPYRLHASVDLDATAVRAALGEGRLRAAVALYRGELLPGSEAPELRAERENLSAAVRAAMLCSGDVEALWRYSRTAEGGQDRAVAERLLQLLPPSDSRSGEAAAWLRRAAC